MDHNPRCLNDFFTRGFADENIKFAQTLDEVLRGDFSHGQTMNSLLLF